LLILAGEISTYVLAANSTNETVTIVNAHSYPNPFDNEKEVTKIKFKIKSEVALNDVVISIMIVDFNGKKVWTKKLERAIVTPGTNDEFEIPWGGENDIGEKVANGLYFCKIIVEANNTVYKVIKILVK